MTSTCLRRNAFTRVEFSRILQKKARNNLSHLLYVFIVMEKLNISCLITYIQFAAEEKRSEWGRNIHWPAPNRCHIYRHSSIRAWAFSSIVGSILLSRYQYFPCIGVTLHRHDISVKIEEAPRLRGCDWKFEVLAYLIRLVGVPAAVLHKDIVLEGTNNRNKPISNIENEQELRYWPFCF